MAGFVYIFSNPLYARIKIGKSKKDPTIDRISELNRETSNPEPFYCEYYAFVGDEHGLEQRIHQIFSDKRSRNNKEFFEVSIEAAYETVGIINKNRPPKNLLAGTPSLSILSSICFVYLITCEHGFGW